MAFPTSSKYVIIGAGIHGLSTAYHLALELKARGKGSGGDIVVLDKTGIAAGASGIACGVVRNNYFQPAMRELMAHSVDVWESDAATYNYHPVGYMQISPEVMHADVGTIYEQQKAIGYESVFIEGAADSMKYMRGLFDDWQAEGITSVLHEKRGGYANNRASMNGLAGKAESEGVRILAGVEVLSYETQKPGSRSVLTDTMPIPLAITGAGHDRTPGFTGRMTGTGMQFRLPEGVSAGRLTVLDLQGRTVWNVNTTAGATSVLWSGLTASGRHANAGVYYARFVPGSGAASLDTKVTLTR
jgi:hypothetical protein